MDRKKKNNPDCTMNENNRTIYSRSTVGRFLSYFKPHWKLFVLDMLCAVFIAGVDLLFPVITRYTLNELLPSRLYEAFFILMATALILYILHTLASYFVAYFGHLFGVLVETDMRRDVFGHVEKQSFSFFDNNRTGHIMSRITYDLFEITELAHHGPEDLMLSVLTLLGACGIMFSIRWELALVVFLLLPLMIMYTMFSRKKLNSSSKKVNEKTSEINASIESGISGIRVTQAFTNENYEERKFALSNREFLKAKQKYYRDMAGFHCKIDFSTHILNVVVLVIGGLLIMKDKMTIGDLVAVNLFVAAFLQPIRRLSNFVEQFTKGMAGFSRFIQIMDTHTEVKDGTLEVNNLKGDILYSGVGFSYNRNVQVLKNINFRVSPGKKIALVGPSGGGKTTICQLLPRFYEISQGKITIDGYDIRDLTLQSLRGQIGMVQQDVFLFAGTIRENIAYGRIDASEEEIIEAAKLAEIHDDIIKMPAGYDSLVGERGVKLSGGQKQRISIARIFLKNPPILILDEATSALDSATEYKIQAAFDKLSRGRTTLVIAHRLSTIRNSHQILVVTDEGIIQSGTHDELMKTPGLYQELNNAQFG